MTAHIITEHKSYLPCHCPPNYNQLCVFDSVEMIAKDIYLFITGDDGIPMRVMNGAPQGVMRFKNDEPNSKFTKDQNNHDCTHHH